jgi:uncharacterized protein YrzB (UPF0473 family)
MDKEIDSPALDATVKLEGDDGHEYECQLLQVFQFEGKEYVLLYHEGEEGQEESESEEDDKDSFVIMQVIEDGDQAIFRTIESEEEFEKVVQFAENLIKEQLSEGEEA